jgi:hypothetical protein
MTGHRTLPGAAAVAASLAFVLFLFAGLARPVCAAAVAVDIGVVVASNDGKSIDPALSSIKSKLQSMFNYSSYRMVDRVKKTLAVGETGDFALPGGRSIKVSPASASGNKVRLGVQVLEGSKNLLTTTLGLTRGGMVLVGGPAYQNGVMILFISAE